MAKGVNAAFAKCFIIFMAAVILAQGVVYLGLAIKGIMLHNCSGDNSDPLGKPFDFLVNLIYFSSDNCGEPVIQVSQGEYTYDLKLQIDFKRANALSDREYIFFISYATISILWVATSFLVLVTIFCKVTKLITIVCFWPWLLSVLLGSVLDAIATGYHIEDIFKSTSFESFFEYVGVVNLKDALDFFNQYLGDFGIVCSIPAIIFACITSRIVLIWLLNTYGVICCFSFARSISENVITICCKITKLITLVCFWPWFLSVLLGSVLDAIATGYHIKDILKTTSFESFLKYVGVVNLKDALDFFNQYLENFGIVCSIPAIIFACITSRILLIWLLNICGVICCFSFARSISANNAEDDKSKLPRRPSSADTAIPFDSNNRTGEQPAALRFRPSQETVRKALSTLEPVPNSPVHRKNKDPLDPVFVLPSVSQQTASSKNSLVSRSPLPSPNPAEASTYQISDAHPENLDYPINRLSTPSTSKTVRSVTPELSAISPLNIRYSTVDGAALFPNSPHVNQELRGQLPWSYMNLINDPVAKQRIQAHRRADEEKNDADEEDKDFPPIPVPDYTTNSPIKERISLFNKTSQKDYSRW